MTLEEGNKGLYQLRTLKCEVDTAERIENRVKDG
jgi:hypothetical protein